MNTIPHPDQIAKHRASAATRVRKKTAPAKPKDFRVLVGQMRPNVIEALQLWGDFEQLQAPGNCSQDWQHVLSHYLTEIFEQCRFDESDPAVVESLRVRLARMVAACEEWDRLLTSE